MCFLKKFELFSMFENVVLCGPFQLENSILGAGGGCGKG